MQLIHVGAAVLNQTPLAWDANRANILAAIERGPAARRQRALPAGIVHQRLRLRRCLSFVRACSGCRGACCKRFCRRRKGMIVSLGLPLLYQNALYDAACLAVDGRIAGFTAKRYLGGDGIHYEPRWFKPWPARPARRNGDRRARISAWAIFTSTAAACRSALRFAKTPGSQIGPARNLSQRGVDIILNPSASHFAFGKMAIRERFVLEGSRAFGVHYVYSNLLGNEAGRAIYDGGAMIASAGQMVAVGPRFSFADWGLTSALVDIDAARLSRARTGSFTPEADEEERACVRCHVRLSAECEPSVADVVARRLGNRSARERRRICPGDFAGAVRLHAQEPLARFCGVDQRRGRFGGGFVPGGNDGAVWRCRARVASVFWRS